MNSAILQFVLLILTFVLKINKCEAVEGNVFTLDDFLNRTFVDQKWDGLWVDDENFIYKKDNYYIFNAKTQSEKIFISGNFLKDYPDATLKVAESKEYVLVKYNISQVYRHSTIADYGILQISSGSYIGLDRFQYCEMTPKGTSLVAVKGNNIIYFPDIKTAAQQIKVTTDGEVGVIYNGIPDWVYEEEVISGDSALWISPKGEYLVYAKFNDEKVKDFTYFTYGEPGNLNDQYPTQHNLKYPKAGTINPLFSLHSYDFASKKTVNISLKFDSLSSDNYILYNVKWRNNNTILVTYTNRLQFLGFLSSCNVLTGDCEEIHKFEENIGWLEPSPPHLMGDSIVQITQQQDFDAFRIMNSATDVKTVQIGNRVISKAHGIVNTTIYFEATESSNHSQQHIYALDLNSEKLSCYSCSFNFSGEVCKYARADFSLHMNFMARICLGPGPAYVDIVNLKEKHLFHWDKVDNSKLREKLKDKAMPIIKDLTVDIPNTRYKAAVRLLLPPSFNQNETKKYPMLVNVYGGPNSNQIDDVYSIDLSHFLVTSRNYIYAYIDGRGSGKREKSLMYAVYKKLGQYEIDDQITVTKWLRDNLNYIDGNKIGIWGWSYGGFATAWAISKDDNSTFKCGVSVAPVTNFIYYDSIYTERYMRLPTTNDNLVGYNKTDLTRRAETFRNKTFLLVHGNADDNVHYQQAMMLARALEIADVPFRQISYPDENHSLGGVLRHLYHSLDTYWKENFSDDITPSPSNRATNSVYRAVPFVFVVGIVLLNIFFR